MAISGRSRTVLITTGRVVNDVLSFIVFSFLDVLDIILCYVYKLVDFMVEAQWKPCYCSPVKAAMTCPDTILVSEPGESKVVRLTSSSQLRLEEISDTLYARSSFVADVSKVNEIKRFRVEKAVTPSSFTVNSAVVEMLKERIGGGHKSEDSVPRWSDCDCKTCHSWAFSSKKDTLYVHVDGAKGNAVQENVLFIHGFISSSEFWTETLFPNFSKSTKSKYRLFAVDLLGFGRSPKPNDSLYTVREHLDMIEKSVLDPYKVKSFHIVAHSLGCILALALAVKYPGSIRSLTLLAPPYFPVPKGEQPSQYMMRRVAPRRVWPPIALGGSIACWYEHVSRTVCLLICKNHRVWDFLTKLVTRNRIRRYLVEGFCCHTHHAAWHTLHNIICGTAGKMETYMEVVSNRLTCDVAVFHGGGDELIPVECSYNVQSRIPRARVKVFHNKDHITLVVGRQKAFATDLEQIWKNNTTS